MTGFASLSDVGTRAVASIPSPSEDWSSLEIGPFTLHVYGFAIATGVLVALWLARSRYMKAGGDPELMDRVAIWVIVAGIIGARIGFVIPRVERFSDDPADAFRIWDGGLTFFGALLAGGIVGVVLLRRADARIAPFLTAVAPAIPLAQAIGRWGNYFNQELYGKPTDLPWALEIDPENRMPDYELYETFHPTFLYEMIWNLALVAGLLFIGRKVQLRMGSLFGIYLVGYGIGRFLMELLRIDTEARVLGLSRNAYNSLGIIILGAVGTWWWETRAPRPESEEAVVEEPGGDDDEAEGAADEEAEADAGTDEADTGEESEADGEKVEEITADGSDGAFSEDSAEDEPDGGEGDDDEDEVVVAAEDADESGATDEDVEGDEEVEDEAKADTSGEEDEDADEDAKAAAVDSEK